MEAAYIDEVLDTVIDLGQAAIPSFIETDKDKKVNIGSLWNEVNDLIHSIDFGYHSIFDIVKENDSNC